MSTVQSGVQSFHSMILRKWWLQISFVCWEMDDSLPAWTITIKLPHFRRYVKAHNSSRLLYPGLHLMFLLRTAVWYVFAGVWVMAGPSIIAINCQHLRQVHPYATGSINPTKTPKPLTCLTSYNWSLPFIQLRGYFNGRNIGAGENTAKI